MDINLVKCCQLFCMMLVLLLQVNLSTQLQCEQCDCIISGNNEDRGVHMTTLTCTEGGITWYNPNGALSLELRPERPGNYRTCYKVDSGDVKILISREGELNVNSKSPDQRSKFLMNDHNLQTISITEGKSHEICVEAMNSVVLYLEPEYKENIGYQKILFQYDSAKIPEHEEPSIEDCRPCSEDEILKAYCSSDFVVVGSMNDVQHKDEIEKTHIIVDVSQIIRQTGSHFNRLRRDSPYLQGTIVAPRKCGIAKGDGTFLMTGRVRLGDLTMGCAPYIDEWETIVTKAELEGRLQCTRD
ncbi:hypothetical protein ACF0H5_001028 [Mactra antiquata]